MKKSLLKRKGSWFLTSSGIPFYPLDPRPEEITISDIAHSLANVCRFGGHCDPFYSVAQHSIHVSKLVPRELALQALLHDAAEAYIGDMVRPLKLHMDQFQTAESRIWKVIAKKFDIPVELAPEVKIADNVALMTERRDVVIWTPHIWSIPEAPDPELIIPLPPGEAQEAFLWRFLELAKFALISQVEMEVLV